MTMPQDCDPEVLGLLVEASELPDGRAKVDLLERALAEAQRLGGFDNEFWARTQLVSALFHVPRERATLTHYAWLRQALATAGDRLDSDDRIDVLWKLKWAISHVVATASIDLATVQATIDDVESAFRDHGYALRPIYDERAFLANELGDPTAAAAALAAFRREPRDRLSNCHACERSSEASLVTDPAEALDLLAPVLSGELTCADEPAYSLAHAVHLYLDIGDHEAAVDAYRRGWPLIKDEPKLVRPAARICHSLARLGSVDRAVDALVPRLEWLKATDDDYHREHFAAVAALVLDAAIERGLAPETIGARPASAVREEMRSLAFTLAAAFDARNGSRVHTGKVEAILATAVPDVPYLPPLRLPDEPAQAEGAFPDSPTVQSDRESGLVPGASPLGVDAGSTLGSGSPRSAIADHAAQLRDRLDVLDSAVDELITAWLTHRDRLLAEAALAPDDPVWADIAFLDRVSVFADDAAIARPILEHAVLAAQRGGDPVQRRRAEIELLLLDADSDEAWDSACTDAERTSAWLEAEHRWADVADVWRSVGRAARERADHDAAVAAWERGLTAQRQAGTPLRLALMATELAQLVAGSDPDRAEALAAEAAEIATAAGHPLLVAMTVETRARLIAAHGDLQRARGVLVQALPRASGTAGEVSVRLLLADVCIELGDVDELACQGAALIEVARSRREPVLLALGQRHLGLAYVETGRLAEAAELLEAALARARTDLPGMVGPIGWGLGNALKGTGEPGAARTAYATAATSFEAAGRTEEAAYSQVRAGDCAWDAEDPVAARAHFEGAVRLGEPVGAVEAVVSAWRSLAVLRALDGPLDDGLAELDAITERAAELARRHEQPAPGEWLQNLALGIARQGARILLRHDRPDDAAARLGALEPRLVGEALAVVQAERGSYLAAAGRLDEAAPVLETALSQLDSEQLIGLRIDCAGRYAEALDHAGRVDEAEAIWARYGSDAAH